MPKMIFEITLSALLTYIIYLYLTREIIKEKDGEAYLIRYFLWKPKKGDKYYLHHIVRSDHDRSEHCHPFNFTSFILWGGYYEIADNQQEDLHRLYDAINPRKAYIGLKPEWKPYNNEEVIRWFGPFSILHRKAAWRHRLLLKNDRSAWTIVKRSPKLREWGFYPNWEFCHNTKYDTKTGVCND